MQIEENKYKRNLRLSAIAFIIASTNTFVLMRNSNVRAVEFLSILAAGIAAGCLLTNLAILNKIKKNGGK